METKVSFLHGVLFLSTTFLSSHRDWYQPVSWLLWEFVMRICRDAACEMLLKPQAVLVCKAMSCFACTA